MNRLTLSPSAPGKPKSPGIPMKPYEENSEKQREAQNFWSRGKQKIMITNHAFLISNFFLKRDVQDG